MTICLVESDCSTTPGDLSRSRALSSDRIETMASSSPPSLLVSRHTRRRDLLVGCAAMCWALSARAEQPSKIYRLGYLASARIPSNNIYALRTGLRELGYVEGKNLKIEYRFAGEQSGTLDLLASELVHLGPDVIVTASTPATLAAKEATQTIPIVMAAVDDPVRAKIVASLAHPGGNITGVTLHASVLSSKRIEVLKEAAPGIARLAILGNATNPFSQYSWEDTQPVARQLGIELQPFMVQGPDELAGAFAAMQQTGASAVVILTDAMFYNWRRQIVALAAERGLPAMSEAREYVEDGGLISYEPNIPEMTHRSAALVDKVLKGAKPAELPIEQPTKFELVINLKTAKTLGLTIPTSLLARADEVIE
jgi:putative tryptophan/tyrosine transport system substrate-binding protein